MTNRADHEAAHVTLPSLLNSTLTRTAYKTLAHGKRYAVSTPHVAPAPMVRFSSSITVASGCVVSGHWPSALQNHIRVLINPANNSLMGPQRGSFPRGGPVPPPHPTRLSARLRAYWSRSREDESLDADLLYAAQCCDGLVHLQGAAELRAALALAPILEHRECGEHVRCRVGEAVLTAGDFNGLPFDAIVHTVPPCKLRKRRTSARIAE